MPTVKADPNANLTVLGGVSVHESRDPRYLEYRREWMENPKNFVVRDFPVHLDIEATNRCNLRCTFCDKLPLLKPEDFGDLDFDLFRKIIDEGERGDLCGLKLSYRGEPLLHPRLAEMVAYAKDHGLLDIYFNTNAMLLTEKKARDLIDARLDRISISVEGVDPVPFERERVGAKFDKIKENVGRLKRLREEMGRGIPKIRIQTVTLPDIDMEEYAAYWGPFCDETASVDYKDVENRDEALVEPDWACPQLWQRMTVEWDGAVMPCNNDDFRTLSPGNLKDISVREAWRAPVVEAARRLHKEGRSHEVEACNGCPWRTTQILKKRERGRRS
ncbi:MAG: hypothetical protein PWQ57_264 [Desulfovibrionales bacterium]|nr:hypothetical protein [Desulfovibrionales bacterium]